MSKSLREPVTPLRLFRRVNQLSQTDAAKLVHCRQSTWNRIERGQAAPGPRLAQMIMKLTNLPLESILVTYLPPKRHRLNLLVERQVRKKKGRAA